jgi:hypothetical protein
MAKTLDFDYSGISTETLEVSISSAVQMLSSGLRSENLANALEAMEAELARRSRSRNRDTCSHGFNRFDEGLCGYCESE